MSAPTDRSGRGDAGGFAIAGERECDTDGLPLLRHVGWAERFPDLVQGVTMRCPGLEFTALAAAGPNGLTPEEESAWTRLRTALRVPEHARARQVHGDAVAVVRSGLRSGQQASATADALATDRAGLLLTVTVADCLPVFVMAPEQRVLGLAHAGWRGLAAGVVARLVSTLGAEWGIGPDELWVHVGPGICGDCYEVGAEVAEALGVPRVEGRVDLPGRAAAQARAAGVGRGRLSRSSHCTRCESERLLSYRAGDRRGRMCAFLGWRPS